MPVMSDALKVVEYLVKSAILTQLLFNHTLPHFRTSATALTGHFNMEENKWHRTAANNSCGLDLRSVLRNYSYHKNHYTAAICSQFLLGRMFHLISI